MKNFDSNTVYNPLSMRATFIELQGNRVSLPAVMSYEPMLRGCDQKAWLERLVKTGIRHLVIPLNGSEEDSCLYARRHPRWAPAATESAEALQGVANAPGVIYDLEHRDEGIFARLQFLLAAAEQIGVLVGLSLFNFTNTVAAGPFRLHGNVQNASFADLARSGKGGQAAREKIETALGLAADWISHEIRGRQAVWMEIFRGATACDAFTGTYDPAAHGFKTNFALRDLEVRLLKRAAAVLTKAGETPGDASLGPWIIVPGNLRAKLGEMPHLAPFDLGCDVTPLPETVSELEQLDAELDELADVPHGSNARRPLLFHFAHAPRSAPRKSSRLHDRARMWRGMMHGCWPVVAGGFNDTAAAGRWQDLAEIATFGRQWVPQGYLRACPEILDAMPPELLNTDRISAATDGSGHYLVYIAPLEGEEHPPSDAPPAEIPPSLPAPGAQGPVLQLKLIPGSYRYFWVDPQTGKGLDCGDSLIGGPRCIVPGLGVDREAVLILQHEELPDPLSIW